MDVRLLKYNYFKPNTDIKENDQFLSHMAEKLWIKRHKMCLINMFSD